MKLDLKFIFILTLILVIGFWTGYFFNQKLNVELQKGTDFTPFFEAWHEIETKFYNFSEKDKEKMLYGAIQGLVDSLGDPYSDFLSPEETSQFKEELTGSYEGIGAEIGIRDNVLTIISPIKGTPAEAAGLLPGDKILEVNGESTKKMSLTQAVMKIRGRRGTVVNLKIKRGDQIFNKKIVRAKIDIPTLDLTILKNDIAYVQLYNFYEDAPSEFEKVYQEILNKNIKKIILDLRNNPGGYLSAAVDIGNFFIEKGRIIVKEDLGKGKVKEIKSKGPGTLSNLKIVILINKGSASASEILAGALKENYPSNTKLIGERSFGKGTVQEFVPLKGGSSLKLTVAHWLLPSGKCIEGNGISPDIEVLEKKEDIEKGKDLQLERAIEELSKF